MLISVSSVDFKLTLALFVCSFLQGCGPYTPQNQTYKIVDKTGDNYQFNIEKRFTELFIVKAQTNSISFKSPFLLENNREYLTVVRTENAQWEGPTSINSNIHFNELGISFLATPVNNRFIELNVGGGLRRLGAELSLVGDNQSDHFIFVDRYHFAGNADVKYRFSRNFAVGAMLTAAIFSGDYSSMMLETTIQWSPIKHLRFDVGTFGFYYSNDLIGSTTLTDDYTIQVREVSKYNDPNLNSCIDSSNKGCPMGDGDSPLIARTLGLKAGVTFIF